MHQASFHVVVTGHSRGLGAALARCALAQGAAVLGLSRQVLAGGLPRAHGQFTETQLDLADPIALQDWLATGALAAWLTGARQAVLVNNAGTVMPMGAAGGLAAQGNGQGPHALAQAVALNVTAPLMLTDAFVAATAQCADRRVVHVSSGAGRSAYPGWSTYCATKAALDMHARATQLDTVAGLRVASVAPGVIDTDMQADIRSSRLADFPMQARFVAMKHEGQLADAADVGTRLLAYVLSDAFGRDPTPDLRQLGD